MLLTNSCFAVILGCSLLFSKTCEYLIIHPESWADAVESYSDFKNEHNIITEIKSVEYILQKSTGADDPEKIKNFIDDYYFNRSLKYVLLVGDVSKIPTRIDTNGGSNWYNRDHENNPYATDFYFFNPVKDTLFVDYSGKERSCDNCNNDRRDIIGGRLPVDLSAQVEKVLNTWMNYSADENEPFDIVFMAPESEVDIKSKSNSEKWLDSSWRKLPDAHIKTFYADEVVTKENIFNSIEQGALFMNYMGHGNYWRWTKPDFAWEDAKLINNKDNPTFLVTQSCRVGDILEFDCLAERLFEAEKGAMLGIIAASNSPMNYDFTDELFQSEWNQRYNKYETNFWGMCSDQYQNHGEIFPCSLFCNLGSWFQNFNYFGDPTLVIFRNNTPVAIYNGNDDVLT
ncbi:MAG: C25 family cysteine peptidase, partial [bacterium]